MARPELNLTRIKAEREGTPDSRAMVRILNDNFQSLRDQIDRLSQTNDLIVVGDIDHGLLAGLADDDHPHYLLEDGTRVLTGNWVNGDDYGIQVPWLQLSTTFTDGVVEGRLQWNAEDGTMEYGLPGGTVVLQVGQELVFKGTNKTGALIEDGSPVYVSGAQGQRPTIAKAQANSLLTGRAVGLATEDIADNASGYVTLAGLVRGLDTSSFSDGDLLYLSPTVAGGMQNTRPTAPDIITAIGYVVNANADGTVIIQPVIIPRMTDLSDVLQGTPADGQVLQWVAANSRFELTTPSAGGATSYVSSGSIGWIWAGGFPLEIP